MIEVKDEKLNGEPKYRIRDGEGNIVVENATIEMTTEVVQEPTPLNKALFDSINKDLKTKLPISDKATTSEAQNGTNDTKYMTPSTTKDFYDSNKATDSEAQGGTNDTKYITPLKLKGVVDKNANIKTYNVTGNINFSDYITDNTYKMELIISAETFYRDRQILSFHYNANNETIRMDYKAWVNITIYPKSNFITFFGHYFIYTSEGRELVEKNELITDIALDHCRLNIDDTEAEYAGVLSIYDNIGG